MSGRGGGIASNPVLIGAATVLVIVVAVFLSYNANAGLPFVPTYQLKLEAPSAASLVRGNEVRVGGTRVGAVDRIEARRREDGTDYALLSLKLERSVAPIARDSTFAIRPRSVLGLKYVEITPGSSADGWVDGDTVPMSATREQVEFDDFLNMFDEDTRAGVQGSLRGGGDALAGRGRALNQALGALPPMLRDLTPVLRNLAADDTQLARLIEALAATASEVAPVAEEQADLFTNLDRTFGALANVREALQDAIEEGPPTLDAGIEDFPEQRPFLANAAAFFEELQPGARALRDSAGSLADTVSVGAPTLERAVGLNRRLGPLLQSVQEFSEDPVTPLGLRRLGQIVEELEPTLRHLAPAQTVCNYPSLFFRNASSLLSEGADTGTWQRFIIIATPSGPNNEGSPASAPANGPGVANHFHSNPYPNTASPGQPRECEAGNEPYLAGRTILTNTPGRQDDRTEPTPRPRGGTP